MHFPLIRIFFFTPGLAGNILLAWIFWSALRFPQNHAMLIAGASPLVLVMEFLSIHASGFLRPPRRPGGIALLCIYASFALVIGWSSQNFLIPLYFVASFIPKYLVNRAVRQYPTTVITMILFLLSLAVFALPAARLRQIFSLYKTPSSQALIFWGIVYFSMLAALEAILFARRKKEPRLPPQPS